MMEERLMKKHIISLAILLASGVSVFGQNTTYLSGDPDNETVRL